MIVSQQEAFAYFFWLVGPVASAMAFGSYYARQGQSGLWAAALCAAATFVAIVFLFVSSDDQSKGYAVLTPLALALWAAWLIVGAPMAASYVAGRKRRSQTSWTILTFFGTSLPLFVLILLPERDAH